MVTGRRINPRRFLASLFLLACCFFIAPIPVAPQGWLEPIRPRPGSWVERVETIVRVEVRGNVASVVVDEWFKAHGHGLGEVDYLYPLPAGAVFSGFSLYQGEEELRGEIMDADRAREIYEEIVRRRRDPALIELAGHGLLRARVFPLNPGETRKVTLRYTQLLSRAGDALHLRYEGGAGSATACSGGGSAPPNRCATEASPMEMEVEIPEGARFLEPFSPTHALTTNREGSRLLVKTQGIPSGPLSLFLPLAREGLGLALATHKPLGEDGYFLLSLSPGRGEAPPEPRDVNIVLDVSGSMSGEKIRQARGALLDLLETLSGKDRFRIVAFSNAVRPFSLNWQEANPGSLAEARDWVNRLEAEGGTNVSAALEEALRLPSPGDRLPVTVFLTDGLPTVGETSVDAITAAVQEKRGRMRVFAFGVGHDVNTALLDRMSEEGRGSTTYVAPGESVERALSLLAIRIQHPILTDLVLAGAPVRLKEIYPVQIPDVFAGEELVLFGRYEEPEAQGARGLLSLEGQRGGEIQKFSLEAHFPAGEEANDFLPRLWASRKLGYLTRRVWTEGESQELMEEIRRTALRYGLPSPYTSYLVLEPEMSPAGMDHGNISISRPASDLRAGVPSFSTQGAQAVGRARRAKTFREVSSMADLQEAEDAVAVAEGGLSGSSRLVAGRLFRLSDGVWKEVAHGEGDAVLTVEPFSRAYFDLLERIPELKAFAREFPQLEVQGEAIRIRILDGGLTELEPVALDSARSAFLQGGGNGL